MNRIVPGWKALIEESIGRHPDQTVIQIATIDKQGDRVVPRVRSQIFRTFFDAPNNFGLPLLLTTTDVRTPKVQQLNSDPIAEVAWWIDHVKRQFRIQSNIHILPTPEHPLAARFMSALANADPESSLFQFKEINWERMRREMFISMSPHMRATWCRPTPGGMLTGGEEEAAKWPKRLDEPGEGHKHLDPEEAKRLWNIALRNFALVIIDPVEVDYVDLGTVPNTRSLFTKRKGSPGLWDEKPLVP